MDVHVVHHFCSPKRKGLASSGFASALSAASIGRKNPGTHMRCAFRTISRSPMLGTEQDQGAVVERSPAKPAKKLTSSKAVGSDLAAPIFLEGEDSAAYDRLLATVNGAV